MARKIAIYPERCVGCRLCSLACSLTKTGECGLANARIWVAHFGEESRYVPATCTHCEDAWCIKACPCDAISRETGGHRTVIDADLCDGCLLCTAACPFEAIVHPPPAGKAVLCDECGGDPYCVKFCPTAAITWEEEDSAQHRRRLETGRRIAAAREE